MASAKMSVEVWAVSVVVGPSIQVLLPSVGHIASEIEAVLPDQFDIVA